MMTLFRAAPVGSSPRRMIAFALGLVLALMAGRALAAGSDEAPAPVLSPIEEVQAVIESRLIAFQNRTGLAPSSTPRRGSRAPSVTPTPSCPWSSVATT